MTTIKQRNDFIEGSESGYVNKAVNYKTKLPNYKDVLGLDEETISKETAMIENVLNLKNEKDEALQRSSAKVKEFRNAQNNLTSYLRKRRPVIQALPGYNSAIGIDLGLETTYTTLDTKELTPDIKVYLEGGYPLIKFKKQGTDGIRIYSRLNGAGQFTLLDTCNQNHYIDVRPKTDPLQNELREYYAFYTIKGKTVGKQSSILKINL